MSSVVSRARRAGRAVCSLLVAFVAAGVSVPVSAGIVNSGFEDSPAGTAPSGWSTDAAADTVVVTATESGTDFPVYADRGITVAPWKGDRMLRLGTPKRVAESQNRGANRVSQTFVPDASELRLALRAFSFEFRGDDRIIVDVKDSTDAAATFPVAGANGQPFTFPGLTGSARSCAATPCRLVVDVGSRNDFLASGWQEIVIGNLPTNRAVTLSVSVEGGENQGHATWMYVDGDPNRAPVAAIAYSPGSKPGTIVQEGDFVAFSCAASTDADGDSLTCRWRATGTSIGELTAEGTHAYFLFPDDDTITMELSVSDGRTVSTATRTIAIANGAPLIAALDRVEVIEGGTGVALCRFLDPGVYDTHDAAITFSAPLLKMGSETFEENAPTLSSGYGRALIDVAGAAPGTYGASCTVSDGDLSASDDFEVVVVSGAEVQTREETDSNSTAGARKIPGGQTVLSALESTTDIDVFEIRSRNGSTLPVGAEVNVMVDVPGDYDIVLFSRNANALNAPFVSAPFVTAPFVSAPFVTAPFVTAPFVTAPFVSAPFVSAPFVTAPFVSAPFVSAPIETSPFVSAQFAFENFPLSQVGLAAPDGSQISGVDIGLGELGAYNLGVLETENLTVKALSAQLGNRSEHILVRVGPGEDALFLALVSQDGTLATAAPASITVEVARPPSQRQVLGANCVGSPLVANATTTTEVLHEPEGDDPLTLIVTQSGRFEATWGEPVLAGLDDFLNHPAVLAKVISVPGNLYDEADTDPCSVAKQNVVAEGIKAVIQAELASTPSIRYVQIIGGPDIVPHYYSPDETTISYEGLYAGELWMKPGKPLAVALAEGFNPTDAFYADAVPQDFRGRALFIEDLPIARLGERPAEIRDAAATFVQANGESPIASILVTGYDFFKDGAQRTADALGASGVQPTTIIDDVWTAADIRCKYLGSGATGCSVPDLSALNAHMNYNALLSAAGFASADQSEVVASTESTGLLFGRTTLTIGCHSGLSFPDAWAIPRALAGLSFDPGRDWGQETGDWIGPITYGIGDDTVADRGTEGIVTLLSEELVAGASLGDALVRAKQRYATGLFDFGVYDEKSVIGLGLFGMPQKRIVGAAAAPAETVAAACSGDVLTVALLEEGTSIQHCLAIGTQDNDRGSWYTLDGEAQGVFGRPLLPATQLIDARTVDSGETRIHGVALRGGRYVDYTEVDPVFPTPQHDWTLGVDEPQPCVGTTSPTQVAVATLFESTEHTLQSLIVQSGQFRCTHVTDAGEVRGEMRIFEELTLEALHPSDAGDDGDFQPPTVIQQDIVADPDSNEVVAMLDATDASGLREIIGLVFSDADGAPGGEGTVTAYSTGDITGVSGPHRLVLANARDQRLAFQYIDGAGNLLMKSLKGTLIQAIEVDILNTVLSFTGPTTIEVFVEGYEGLEAPSIEIDFGDGQPRVIDLSTDPLPDGVSVALLPPAGTSVDCDDDAVVCDAIVSIVNDFGDVGPEGVTVTVTVRAIGAVGSDSAVLSRFCDPLGDASFPNADIVGCAFKATGTRVEFDLYVAGVIASDVQYRLELPQSGALFKFFDGGKTSAPTGVRLTVTRLGDNGLRYAFDAARLGWNGTTPLLYKESTQAGVPGTPNEGFPDETVVLTGYP